MRTMNEATATGPIITRVLRDAAWAPLAVLILHALLGSVLGHEPYVDPTMHFLGGAAAAFFVRHASRVAGRLLGGPTQYALDLLAFGSTCAIALFWEFGEFASDQYFGTHIQRSLENTMRDLVLGVSGAVVYLAAHRLIGSFQEHAV